MLKDFCIKHHKLFGSIGVIAAIVMSIAGLEVFLTNMRGETNIIFQPLALAVNGFFWVLYAIGTSNKFVLIPNAALLLFSLATFLSAFIF